MALDLDDAAGLLGVSAETVRRWARQGRLGTRRPSGEFRFEMAELRRWAANQGLRVREPGPVASRGSHTPADALPLTAALGRGAVLQGLPGASPDEVLAALVARAPLPEAADRDALLEQLRARERMASTGLGEGVALPHPRTPSARFVQEPTVVVAMLARPAEWNAIDGQPVHTAILLLSPTPPQHLQVLSRLSYVLRDARFVGLLRERAGAAAIHACVEELEPHAG